MIEWIGMALVATMFILVLWFLFFVFIPMFIAFAREQEQFIRDLEEAQRNGLNVKHFLAGSGLLKPEYEAEAQRELLELRLQALEKKL